ncbi:unnamed protein product [Sympodiomycopsis kandeliae]
MAGTTTASSSSSSSSLLLTPPFHSHLRQSDSYFKSSTSEQQEQQEMVFLAPTGAPGSSSSVDLEDSNTASAAALYSAFTFPSPAASFVAAPMSTFNHHTASNDATNMEIQSEWVPSTSSQHQSHQNMNATKHNQQQQQQQGSEDSATLTPAEARRLKRKEQNRLAQRRHREKQRSQMRKQRQGSNEGSGADSDPSEQQPLQQQQQQPDLTYPSDDVMQTSPISMTLNIDTGNHINHRHPSEVTSSTTSDHGFSSSSGGEMGDFAMSDPSSSSSSSSAAKQYSQSQHHLMPPPNRTSHPHHGGGYHSPMQVPIDQFDYSQLLNGQSSSNDHFHQQQHQHRQQHTGSSEAAMTTGMASGSGPVSTLRPSDLHSGSSGSSNSNNSTDFFGSSDAEAGSSMSGGPFAFDSSTLPPCSSPLLFHQSVEFGSDDHQVGNPSPKTTNLPWNSNANGSEERDPSRRKKRSSTSNRSKPGSENSLSVMGRPMSNAELLKYFASLTSLQVPWADRLLGTRWDVIKVLQMASEKLGLMYEYVEGDFSISFLAQDFLSATSGLGSGPAISGPGQTELGKWPTEQEPHLRVPSPLSRDGKGPASGTENGLGPVLRWSHVPENMRPSRLSGIVSHHPYIDLSFPWPIFRDRILAAMSCHLLHEVDLCMEIWPGEDFQPVGAEPPYWIHGDDPFDPESYEVSDRLAKRYPWLLDASIIRRTNWWRRQQSKAELPALTSQVSRAFAPFFQQQIEHLQDPDRVPKPSQLPQALDHFGVGSMMPSVGQYFGRTAQERLNESPYFQQQSGHDTSDRIATLDDVNDDINSNDHHKIVQ